MHEAQRRCNKSLCGAVRLMLLVARQLHMGRCVEHETEDASLVRSHYVRCFGSDVDTHDPFGPSITDI
eukprot:364162-Chlamydomonas_euryale.AAC.2